MQDHDQDQEREHPEQTPENATAPPATAEADLEALVAEERAKAERYLANWQRAQADFQNYKRRAEQEQEERTKFANAMLVLKLLPVVDDLERALDTIPANLAGLTWFDGVRLITRKLQAVLESEGVKLIEADGKEFDPRYHEAVLYEPGEQGKVLQVLQKGYQIHDRVIRPAMVKVGNGEPVEQSTGEKKEASGGEG